MTEAQKITYIGTLCEESNTDVLSAYLSMAETIAKEKVFPFGCTDEGFVEKTLHRYDPIICEIAVYLVNKRGAEGEKAHTESTAERTYENGGVPDSIMKKLIPYCGVL